MTTNIYSTPKRYPSFHSLPFAPVYRSPKRRARTLEEIPLSAVVWSTTRRRGAKAIRIVRTGSSPLVVEAFLGSVRLEQFKLWHYLSLLSDLDVLSWRCFRNTPSPCLALPTVTTWPPLTPRSPSLDPLQHEPSFGIYQQDSAATLNNEYNPEKLLGDSDSDIDPPTMRYIVLGDSFMEEHDPSSNTILELVDLYDYSSHVHDSSLPWSIHRVSTQTSREFHTRPSLPSSISSSSTSLTMSESYPTRSDYSHAIFSPRPQHDNLFNAVGSRYQAFTFLTPSPDNSSHCHDSPVSINSSPYITTPIEHQQRYWTLEETLTLSVLQAMHSRDMYYYQEQDVATQQTITSKRNTVWDRIRFW